MFPAPGKCRTHPVDEPGVPFVPATRTLRSPQPLGIHRPTSEES